MWTPEGRPEGEGQDGPRQRRGPGLAPVKGEGPGKGTSQLLEWSPLIVFFVGFKLLGIYWATAALMIACLFQLAVHRLRSGEFKTMHIITSVVVMVLGSATLLLHDRRFIQWKPTVLLALASAAFLGSMVVGKQPFARRMLEAVFNEPLNISPRTWLVINSLWAAWLALLAVANIYVAWNFTESIWVNFKVFGISAAMLIFMLPQVLWLSGKTKAAQCGGGTPEQTPEGRPKGEGPDGPRQRRGPRMGPRDEG